MAVPYVEIPGEIESSFPAPENWAPGRPSKYPFTEMNVGDSFMIKCVDSKIPHVRHRLLSAAKSHSRYNKLKRIYATRRVPGGARIWRVK